MQNQQTIRLSISGLSCAGCVSAAEQAVNKVAGVEEATVSLGERTVTVQGSTDVVDIIAAIQQAGYNAAQLTSLADEQEKEQQEQAEYKALWRRVFFAGGVGVTLFVLGMGKFLPSLTDNRNAWLLVSFITLLVMIISGKKIYLGAWHALMSKRGNMDTLIALGTGTAWGYSTVLVLFPNIVPVVAQHLYFEAAVMIIALVSLGSALEMSARSKTSVAIKRLIGLQPKTARVIRDGKELDIAIEEVGLDETIRIRPGDKIPVDGELFEGESYVDEAMLTGEPIPVHKELKSRVFAGTINTSGSFLMKSIHIGRDTALANIVELVRKAQASKPAIGRLVDKVAAVFVPIVVAIAFLSFIVWYLFGPEPQLAYAMVAAMTVLVIACPCALGLATPISIMVAVGRAAESGILVRNGEALQQASKITTVVLDKTGTITEGKPTITDIICLAEESEEQIFSNDQILGMAAALETGSEHPLAKAILDEAESRDLTIAEVSEFNSIAGHGVAAKLNDRELMIGNTAMIQGSTIDTTQFAEQVQELSSQGKTVIYLATRQQVIGLIAIADAVKVDSKSAINKLQQQALQVVMLTGDSEVTAKSVVEQIGIDKLFAELLPEDKVNVIKELQQAGEVVAMVGDGGNDAPALAQADVGIAIGTGTDVAIESADVALMRSSLDGVPELITLSHATLRNIKQNLFGAFIYNSLGIPVAAGLLYPCFGILLSPVMAAAAMSMSSVTVVTNALRLRNL